MFDGVLDAFTIVCTGFGFGMLCTALAFLGPYLGTVLNVSSDVVYIGLMPKSGIKGRRE
jgi:hypothetical protein